MRPSITIISRVESCARRGFTLRSWNSASCFRRKRFSAAKALREWVARKASRTKSNATRDSVRKQCAIARKINQAHIDAQDRTLRNVTGTTFSSEGVSADDSWKSRPVGRPRIPKDLRRLIREMATENPTWGEERIANELKLKLAIRVSPRTVGKYLRMDRPVRPPDPKQRWLSFLRNHAKVIVACDFFVVITATFRTLYVFVVIEIGSRKILHHNVTAHPTAVWTLQQ